MIEFLNQSIVPYVYHSCLTHMSLIDEGWRGHAQYERRAFPSHGERRCLPLLIMKLRPYKLKSLDVDF